MGGLVAIAASASAALLLGVYFIKKKRAWAKSPGQIVELTAVSMTTDTHQPTDQTPVDDAEGPAATSLEKAEGSGGGVGEGTAI